MFPPFPEEEAFDLSKKLISAVESGKVQLKQLSRVSEERKDQGIMIGILTAREKASSRKRIFYTVSGISKELTPFEDWEYVEPVVDSASINAALFQNDEEIHVLTEKINQLKASRKNPDGSWNDITSGEKELIEKRAALTNESLKKVYSLYSFCCADNKIRSLNEICPSKFPPTGTGDCCAPKLLNRAFSENLVPLSMCEVFYGNAKGKISGEKYGPCDIRCRLILPAILGLEILYRDENIIVVNKQSGVLSVPGRGPEKQDCIVNRFLKLFPEAIKQPSVHRLDMETSGLMVLAFTESAHRELNRQFENREVYKEYEALLDGKLIKKDGNLELYFRLDPENRPHQVWDSENGKKALTEYHVLDEEKYVSPSGIEKTVSRVRFIPHTGRTHQLRLASADSHGIGFSIIGDTLYGKCEKGERLMLHAKILEFTHPVTGERMKFQCLPDF